MSGRTPAQAAIDFLEPFRQAFSLVTGSVPGNRGGYYVSEDPHVITLGTGDRVRLSGETRVHIRFVHYYRSVREDGPQRSWSAETTTYFYSLDDADQREIIAFHWHPTKNSPIRAPHLHLGPGARVGYDRLHRAHIPTGHITIQDVLLLAINDLGVEPLIDRETALQTLSETRA